MIPYFRNCSTSTRAWSLQLPGGPLLEPSTPVRFSNSSQILRTFGLIHTELLFSMNAPFGELFTLQNITTFTWFYKSRWRCAFPTYALDKPTSFDFTTIWQVRPEKGSILLNHTPFWLSGVMHPDSGCGCHAGDHESYEMYKELFHPVIEMYHKGFKIATDRYGRGSRRKD